MPYFMELPFDDGSLKVDVTHQVQGVQPVGRTQDLVGRLDAKALEAGLERVRDLAGEVLGRMRDAVDPPDVVTVEFGVTLSAKMGVVLAESSGEAHLKVSAEWRRGE